MVREGSMKKPQRHRLVSAGKKWMEWDPNLWYPKIQHPLFYMDFLAPELFHAGVWNGGGSESKYLKRLIRSIKRNILILKYYCLCSGSISLFRDLRLPDQWIFEKIGFTKVPPGYSCEKGDTIVLKAGYFRLRISAPADKEQLVRVPSSMTDDDWNTLNRLTSKTAGKPYLCFVQESIFSLASLKQRVRTIWFQRKKQSERILQRSWRQIGKMIFLFFASHTAHISIRGVNFHLHDVNSFKRMSHEDNPWVQKFQDLMRDEAVPRFYKNFNKRKEDVNYDEIPCQFSMGWVDFSNFSLKKIYVSIKDCKKKIVFEFLQSWKFLRFTLAVSN